MRGADFGFLNVFGRKIRRKSALRNGILFKVPELQVPKSCIDLAWASESDCPLHFDMRIVIPNSYGEIIC